MEFDVILHGKPIAGSHRVTKGLDDDFCQNLVDKFFLSMGKIKDSETLIVDTRNWKGKWYSVYTFWLGHNITDTADRTSFLAISMVVPDQYVCLVSAVYTLLKSAYREHIIGTYLSPNGKYIVQDFNDNAAFEKLYTFLNGNFVNLSEELDDSFKQTSENISNIYYNLLDCDSKAFVEALKKNGRIFVSNTYDTKDSRLANVDKYFNELQIKNAELGTKDGQIKQLTEQIKNIDNQLKDKNNSVSKTVESLKKQIGDLSKEKEALEHSASALKKQNQTYQQHETEIAILLGMNVQKTSHQQDSQNKTGAKPITKYLTIINTFLLVILVMGSSFKSCSSYVQDSAGMNVPSSDESLQTKIDSLKEIIKENNNQIEILKNSSDGGEFKADVVAVDNEKDEDCELEFYQNNMPVSRENIDVKEKLMIKVKREIEGYSFYTSNLNLNGTIISGRYFKLERMNPKSSIVIVYRSNDKKKRNDNNVITIN